MTWNSQFCLICNFSNLFPPNDQFWGGGGVNDQTHIVNTKLPNENIQFYQLQLINSGGGVGVNYQMQIVIKLPNGTTRVAHNDSEQPILPNSQVFQSLPTTDDQFWGGGGVNYQTQIMNTKLPNENLQTYQLQMINLGRGGKLPNANCEHQTTK